MNLAKYVLRFTRLRVDRSKGKPAPHKSILLLAVIDGVEKREIIDNQIRITPELVAAFKDFWHKLIHNTQFTANFSLPFYHLKSDGFWHLQTCLGRELLLTSSHSIKSFAQLKQVIDFAFLDVELFELLRNEHTRQILKQTLLDTFFPNESLHGSSNELIREIVHQILHEPAALYKTKAKMFDEEEVFIRGGVFKKEIPKIYNYSCAISGMRIIANSDIQMVDACHIVPFSESHDDTITNGISLCPNLHRAFDRGLIALDNEYKVLIKSFVEDENFYSIKQFEFKKILLPSKIEFLPSQENLAAHRYKHKFS